MIKSSDSSIVVKKKKLVSIPKAFEPVARRKQTEESDRIYDAMDDENYVNLSAERVSDDEDKQDDDFQPREPVSKEERYFHEDDGTDTLDE